MKETDDKNLYLLDAYALIFRAYFALAKNPMRTSDGIETSAIYGFVNTLLEIMEKRDPSHIAVVFDTDKPTKRHEEYEEYKANRSETPEAILVAVPYIKEIIRAYGIPILSVDGYEADDVIGTLAKKAEKENYTTYMVTSDKDFGQLLTDKIKMYKPGRKGGGAEVWGREEMCEYFGIENVEQVIDMLGMMGDSSDNIPGLPGVGAKTAKKLLAQYGSLENTIEHAGEIKGKLGEKIRDNAELGVLSKKLATIMLDAPVELNEKDLTRTEPDKDKLREIFTRLEFRALTKRVLGEELEKAGGGQMDLFGNGETESPIAEQAPRNDGLLDLEQYDHSYQLLNDIEDLDLLVKHLLEQKSVAFDTETTALKAMEAELVGISFCYSPGKAYFVRTPDDKKERKSWLEKLQPFFENEEIEKVGHNIKYDLIVLMNEGLQIRGPVFDTMIAHYLLQPDMKHNMDQLARNYLNYDPLSIEKLIGSKGSDQKSMRDVDTQILKEYAAEDADVTFQLKELFAPAIADKGIQRVFAEIEMPLVPVLARMEVNGVNLDKKVIARLSSELGDLLEKLEKEILDLAGGTFNIASPKQLGEVLFEKLKLVDKPKKTKSGQYATSEEVLLGMRDRHEIVEKILDFRQVSKLKSTYVEPLPKLINKNTGRIHTSFNQTVAATGRLSSNAPNLQNIPIRTERGQYVRKAFTARNADYLILAADYSQIELRLIAEMSGEENMKKAFLNGEDIHASTASRVFGVPLEGVTREQRGNAKTVNFGIIYGVSAFGLSQQTGLSRSEAAEIIESYFKTYPAIKKYMDKQIEFAREHGYVETIMGRRRYLEDINSRNHTVRGHAERNAINAPVQGSAADVIKLAMVNIQSELEKMKAKTLMTLQVHDELVFDAYRKEEKEVGAMVKEKMENAVKTEIPLEVELGSGENWLEAH